MRIGIELPNPDPTGWATTADRAGLPLVGVPVPAGGGVDVVTAGAVAAATTDCRIVVGAGIGRIHPVELAEQIAVLDALSGGRVVALCGVDPDATGDTADLSEDVALLRLALRAAPVQHAGPRWRVAAGLEEHTAPASVEVTPKPVQLVVPVWADTQVAPGAADAWGTPRVAAQHAEISRFALTAPARAALSGALDVDRDAVVAWAHAGATELLVVPDDRPAESVVDDLARFMSPEVAMPHFPRLIAESGRPAAWPGHGSGEAVA